jgi:hypothetical protein
VEDQGRAQIQYTLPPGATQPRTEAAAKVIQDYFRTEMQDGVQVIYTVTGQGGGGGGGGGQNAGRGFMMLKPWDQRTTSLLSADAIAKRATRELGKRLRDADDPYSTYRAVYLQSRKDQIEALHGRGPLVGGQDGYGPFARPAGAVPGAPPAAGQKDVEPAPVPAPAAEAQPAPPAPPPAPPPPVFISEPVVQPLP